MRTTHRLCAPIIATALGILLLVANEQTAAARGGGFGGGFGGGHFGHFGHGFRRFPHPLWRHGFLNNQTFFGGGGVIPAYVPSTASDYQQSGAPCQETVTVTNERGGTSQITITRCTN
jgi:hypothetical protein